MEIIMSKLCDRHVEAVKAEIERRGMTEQCAWTDAERESRLSSGNPDPFLDAQLRLQMTALTMAGRAACVLHPCPACALERADWCSLAVRSALTFPEAVRGVMRFN
jgi:hypothetical protein